MEGMGGGEKVGIWLGMYNKNESLFSFLKKKKETKSTCVNQESFRS